MTTDTYGAGQQTSNSMQTLYISRQARLVLVTLLLAAMPAAASAREFRLGLITPPSHLWTQAAEQFGAELARHSAGSYRVSVFPSRQLGTEAQMLQLLQTGALDFAILTVSELSNRLPELGVFATPYLVRDASEAADLLSSTSAQQLLLPLPDRLGVVGIGFTMAGMRQILSKPAVTNTAQLRGLKIRITPSPPVRDFYRLLGAAPTPMPLSAVFDALANGQIDAIDMDLESIVKLRYHEYASTLLLSRHMMFPAVAVASQRTWQQLDPTQQALVGGLLREQLAWINRQYPLREQEWQETLADTQLQVLEVGPDFFSAARQAWLEQWANSIPALEALRQTVDKLREDGRP